MDIFDKGSYDSTVTDVFNRQSFCRTQVDSKKYRSYVKKMPSLIQVNGLGQTLAFYFSKIDEKVEGRIYGEIYRTVATWLKRQFPEQFRESTEEDHQLIKTVINLGSRDYRTFAMETLALLNWMRKFVDGLVTSDEA